MKKTLFFALVMCFLIGTVGTALADVFPGIELETYNESTGYYQYKITCPSNSTYPFGQLKIFCEVANVYPYNPWAGSGPVSDPSTPRDLLWNFWIQMRPLTDPRMDNACWTADDDVDVIPANTAWIGRFALTVPNSRKVDGIAVTMDGGPGSQNEHLTSVPGPAPLVPEPTGLLALGTLAGALVPLLRRRK